jgi:uncharacterized protein YutE (UPF0331/DUF86 family)
MDRDVVEQKLESLRRCLLRLQEKCPADAEKLLDDLDVQDIIALNLSRAVQISVDIAAHIIAGMNVTAPETMGQAFEVLAQQQLLSVELAGKLKKAVGFHNIAVHNYEAINWLMVHSIVTHNLADFTRFAQTIFKYIEKD